MWLRRQEVQNKDEAADEEDKEEFVDKREDEMRETEESGADINQEEEHGVVEATMKEVITD